MRCARSSEHRCFLRQRCLMLMRQPVDNSSAQLHRSCSRIMPPIKTPRIALGSRRLFLFCKTSGIKITAYVRLQLKLTPSIPIRASRVLAGPPPSLPLSVRTLWMTPIWSGNFENWDIGEIKII